MIIKFDNQNTCGLDDLQLLYDQIRDTPGSHRHHRSLEILFKAMVRKLNIKDLQNGKYTTTAKHR